MLFHKVYICICKTVRDDVFHVFLCIMHPWTLKNGMLFLIVLWLCLGESKFLAEVTGFIFVSGNTFQDAYAIQYYKNFCVMF